MEPAEPDDSIDPAEEVLRRLEQRLERASDAAERLIARARSEVAASGGRGGEPSSPAGAGGEPSSSAGAGGPSLAGGGSAGGGLGSPGAPPGPATPPSGWQLPEDPAQPRSPSELELLAQLIASLRDLIPAELAQRLVEAVREMLLAIRALIDWYLERIDRRRSEPPEVQDIPVL